LLLVEYDYQVIAIDTGTGERVWQRGDSAVALVDPRARLICVKLNYEWDTEDGPWPPDLRFDFLDRDGRVVTKREVYGANPVKALDDVHIVVFTRRGLRCESIADGTNPLWEIPGTYDQREPLVPMHFLPTRGRRLVRWGWKHLSVLAEP